MEHVEDKDEQLLLQQLSEGNAEAFRHLYVRYYPKIFYFVQGLLKSEMDTEDVVQEIFSIIRDVNESGTTVLLVEQNAKMALTTARRAYVLETGMIVMSGMADELMNNEQVQRAYLGGE